MEPSYHLHDGMCMILLVLLNHIEICNRHITAAFSLA